MFRLLYVTILRDSLYILKLLFLIALMVCWWHVCGSIITNIFNSIKIVIFYIFYAQINRLIENILCLSYLVFYVMDLDYILCVSLCSPSATVFVICGMILVLFIIL